MVAWLKEYRYVVMFVSVWAVPTFFYNYWADIRSFDFSAFYWAADAYLIENPWTQYPLFGAFAVMALVLLIAHLRWPHEGYGANWLVVAYVVIMFIYFVYLAQLPKGVTLFALLTTAVAFGILTFTLASELLVEVRIGRYLTARYGDTWIKRMEYVYLLLGYSSIVGSMNKFTNITGKIALWDTIAPIVLTLAVAIKCVKTRAEIEGWNTGSFYQLLPPPKY